MADNITITEGTAKAIAADDVASVWYQKIKLDVGADGLSSPFTGTIDEITNIASGTIKSIQGGTIGNLASGSVVVTTGTIAGFGEIGTLNVLEDGTVSKVGTVTGVGVLALGTVKMTEGSAVLKSGTITTILAGTQELLGTVANLAKGTITKIEGGTVANLASGSVVVTAGSVIISDGTVVTTMGDLTGGTIDAITAGTLTVGGGTVTTILAGTQELLGTVANLAKGTITRLEGGTLGVLTSLTAGTIAMSLGTIAIGTVVTTSQLAGTQELLGTAKYLGTVGTIVGTLAAVGTVAKVGTVDILTAGTITRVQGGTVGNLASGSVVVTVGTITNVGGGTVQVNPKSPTYVTTYGTMFAGAGSAWGTLSAVSGAGTYHYVSGADIVVKSGTVDAVLSFGSVLNGTGVLARGSFPEGGGISKTFSPALRSSGTNSELMCEIAGAGTVEFKAEFWRGV